jgi:hypothetical protein
MRPSPPLSNTVRRGRCEPRDTVPPTSVRLTRRALEGGPVEPSNAFPVTTQDYAVTSAGGSGLLRRCQPRAAIPATAAPRRVLRRHPRCCWSARGQDIVMPATVPRMDPR